MGNKRFALPVGCIVLGAGIAVTGVLVSLLVIPGVFDDAVRDALIVNSENDSDYDDWLVLDEDDSPKYKIYYMFDLENPDAVLLNLEKPSFRERGPYAYRIYETKTDVSFHDEDQVTYGRDEIHVFDREASRGDPMLDTVTNVSPTYINLIYGAGQGDGVENVGSERLAYTGIFSFILPEIAAGYGDEYAHKAEADMVQTVLDVHRQGFRTILLRYVFEVAAESRDDFFNLNGHTAGDPAIDGLVTRTGIAEAFSVAQQNAIFDAWTALTPPDLEPPVPRGIPLDKSIDSGLLSFVERYVAGDLVALAAEYGDVTEAQLTALNTYATYLIDSVLNAYLGGLSEEQAFQQQFAAQSNPASPAGGMEVFPGKTFGWELDADLGLTPEQLAGLLAYSPQGSADGGIPGSLLNENFENGLGIWLVASDPSTGATGEGAQQLLQLVHQLSEPQYNGIVAYLGSRKGAAYADYLSGIFTDISSREDLGPLQWATGRVTGGNRLLESEYYAVATNPSCEPFQADPAPPTDVSIESARFFLSMTTEQIGALVIFQQQLAFASESERIGMASYIGCATIAFMGVPKPIYSTRTVHEWLFEYEDPILTALNNTEPGAIFGNDTTQNPPDTFNTGAKDIDLIGQYIKWQELSEIPGIWEEPETITGTDGTKFKPGLSKSDSPVKTWVSDFLRVVDLVYEEDVSFKGISLKRFRLDPDLLEISPEYKITIRGMQDVTSIAGGPSYASKPHFFDADEAVGNVHDGLSPDRDLHDTYIDVEPITGVAMRVHKRLQVSIRVKPNDFVYTSITDGIFPLVWVDESGEISNKDASTFKEKVTTPLQVATDGTFYGGIAVGGLMVLSSIGALIYTLRKPPSETDLALSNLGY